MWRASRNDPFLGAGLRVRIRFPPAGSQVRTRHRGSAINVRCHRSAVVALVAATPARGLRRPRSSSEHRHRDENRDGPWAWASSPAKPSQAETLRSVAFCGTQRCRPSGRTTRIQPMRRISPARGDFKRLTEQRMDGVDDPDSALCCFLFTPTSQGRSALSLSCCPKIRSRRRNPAMCEADHILLLARYVIFVGGH
jgi:hypothetical protein